MPQFWKGLEETHPETNPIQSRSFGDLDIQMCPVLEGLTMEGLEKVGVEEMEKWVTAGRQSAL